jgi:hypothetical protein
VVRAAKEHNLKKTEVTSLLKFAKERKIHSEQVNQLGGFLSQGMGVQEAIDSVSHLRRIAISVIMPVDTIARLEKKYGSTIHRILIDHLVAEKTFKITNRESLLRTSGEKGQLTSEGVG